MNPKNLSRAELSLYEFLYNYSRENGYPPSYQEMVDRTGSNSKSHIAYRLKKLEQAGWVEKTPHLPRAIRLTRDLPQPDGDYRIPLYGVIQAGAPIPIPGSDFAIFLPDEDIPVGNLLPPMARKEGVFALRVQGDSMIDANVQDKDIIILIKTSEARKGQMVAAWLIDEEATTLKHYYPEKERIRLQPANPQFEPIYCRPNQVEVQGRVLMVMRSCP